MRRLLQLLCGLGLLVVSATGFAEEFDYLPPGDLVSGSGEGRQPQDVWVSGMRFPVEEAPAYANSQVYNPGGIEGPGGTECDAKNYSYPWRDNYCEKRSWNMPLCPAGEGHQGQDIRPKTCERRKHWVVAAEAGTITNIGGYSVWLTTPSGRTHRYLHVDVTDLAVAEGDEVAKGDRIGKISDRTQGGTHKTTIHLHYDIKQYVEQVGTSAYVPPYRSLIEAYERLIGATGSDYRADMEVVFPNGEDFYSAGTSEGKPDLLPGETIEAAVMLENAGTESWPHDTRISYWFQDPYLEAVDYEIQHDHPAHDRESWSVSTADDDEANPPDDQLGASGRLEMHGFEPGITKRVVFTLRAKRYSIGADHPDVRSWVNHVDGIYGEQTGFREEPTNANEFGKLVRSFAELDVLSRDKWFFEGTGREELEGWRPGGTTEEMARNTKDDALAQHVDGDDARAISPEWTRIDAGDWPQLVVRARAHDGPHEMGIYWAREGEDFSSERVVEFEAVGDGDFYRYVVPVGRHVAWNGTIDRLRIDQLQDAAPSADDNGWYDIDYLFFQSPDAEATNTARKSFVAEPPVDLTHVRTETGEGSADSGADSGRADVGTATDTGFGGGDVAGSSIGPSGSSAACSSSAGRNPPVWLAIFAVAAGLRVRRRRG